MHVAEYVIVKKVNAPDEVKSAGVVKVESEKKITLSIDPALCLDWDAKIK